MTTAAADVLTRGLVSTELALQDAVSYTLDPARRNKVAWIVVFVVLAVLAFAALVAFCIAKGYHGATGSVHFSTHFITIFGKRIPSGFDAHIACV